MSRALVAVFKSQTMAEVGRRNLTDIEAALALVDLAAHYASRAPLPVTAAALAVVLADAAEQRQVGDSASEARP